MMQKKIVKEAPGFQIKQNHLTDSPLWRHLQSLAVITQSQSLSHLIKEGGDAWLKRMSFTLGTGTETLTVNLARNYIVPKALDSLIQLAVERGVASWRNRMFAGEKINISENRAVLHTALRNIRFDHGVFSSLHPVLFEGNDVMPSVVRELNRMSEFSDKILNGLWKGYTGHSIKTVVSIGIGGSDLGPRMAEEALKRTYGQPINVIYVSNVDGTDMMDVLRSVEPESTLFIVQSKTFTTQETITNAASAKKWFLKKIGLDDLSAKQAVAKHFIAVSTNENAVNQFGIESENMFGFWDWVGGRYSLTSAIGLPLMLSIGKENFANLLAGFHEVDEHFRTAPIQENIPMLLGLLDVWHINFMDIDRRTCVAYDKRLSFLGKYLTQAYMESLGKSEDREGHPVDYATGYLLLPGVGTDDQHAWFQEWHQSPYAFPGDLVGVIRNENSDPIHHMILLSNLFAQAEALANGDPQHLIHGTVFSGNRSTNMMLLDSLTPKTLGMLIALWEHRIFVQGMIWGVNPFDQPGVQLGKLLTKAIHALLNGMPAHADTDPVTQHLVATVLHADNR